MASAPWSQVASSTRSAERQRQDSRTTCSPRRSSPTVRWAIGNPPASCPMGVRGPGLPCSIATSTSRVALARARRATSSGHRCCPTEAPAPLQAARSTPSARELSAAVVIAAAGALHVFGGRLANGALLDDVVSSRHDESLARRTGCRSRRPPNRWQARRRDRAPGAITLIGGSGPDGGALTQQLVASNGHGAGIGPWDEGPSYPMRKPRQPSRCVERRRSTSSAAMHTGRRPSDTIFTASSPGVRRQPRATLADRRSGQLRSALPTSERPQPGGATSTSSAAVTETTACRSTMCSSAISSAMVASKTFTPSLRSRQTRAAPPSWASTACCTQPAECTATTPRSTTCWKAHSILRAARFGRSRSHRDAAVQPRRLGARLGCDARHAHHRRRAIERRLRGLLRPGAAGRCERRRHSRGLDCERDAPRGPRVHEGGRVRRHALCGRRLQREPRQLLQQPARERARSRVSTGWRPERVQLAGRSPRPRRTMGNREHRRADLHGDRLRRQPA